MINEFLRNAMKLGGVSSRHQFIQKTSHPGSKSNKSAKSRREKAKRHQRRSPECCGQRAKGRR